MRVQERMDLVVSADVPANQMRGSVENLLHFHSRDDVSGGFVLRRVERHRVHVHAGRQLPADDVPGPGRGRIQAGLNVGEGADHPSGE